MTTPRSKDAENDLRRVQFDLLPSRLDELDQLMKFCGLNTRRDLFDNAMTLFEWAIEEIRAGRVVASYDRRTDHVEVVRFPVLDNAAKRATVLKSVPLVSTAKDSIEALNSVTEHRDRQSSGQPGRRSIKPLVSS